MWIALVECVAPVRLRRHTGSTWLNWRTVDAPGKKYRCFGADSGGALAAFVVTGRGAKRGLQILYVMEALSRGPEYDELLLQLLRDELASAGADGVDLALCLCPPTAPNRRTYRRAGFWALPKSLHPVETHFGVKPLVNFPQSAARQECWYISYLDADAL